MPLSAAREPASVGRTAHAAVGGNRQTRSHRLLAHLARQSGWVLRSGGMRHWVSCGCALACGAAVMGLRSGIGGAPLAIACTLAVGLLALAVVLSRRERRERAAGEAVVAALQRERARQLAECTSALQASEHSLQRLLDGMSQAVLRLGLDGKLEGERSAALVRWFGPPPTAATLADYLGPEALTFTKWLDCGLEKLRDEFVPLDAALDQLPKRFEWKERSYHVAYTGLTGANGCEGLLLLISDVSEQIAHERADREQRELAELFRRISLDRAEVEEFLGAAARLVSMLRASRDPTLQRRLLDTLGSECASHGLCAYAELIAGLARDLVETAAALSDSQRSQIVVAWKQTLQRADSLLGESRPELVEVDVRELEALAARAALGAAPGELSQAITDLQCEPATRRLERLGRHATSLARRLGKVEPQIEVDGVGLRLARSGWGAYWACMVHVVRNAVEHGIEDPELRAQAGKPAIATLRLRAERRGTQLIVSVADDGRGIDLARLKAKAAALGSELRDSRADAFSELDELQRAAFESAEAHASDQPRALSERDKLALAELLFGDAAREPGALPSGLQSLAEAVQLLGGSIEVEAARGQGTVFRCIFEEARLRERPIMATSLLPIAR
jgi:chemotaxis protein histidine kinase CheA